MTGKMVVDAQASPKKKRFLRPEERTLRVRLALDALIAEGVPFHFGDVARRAGIARTLFWRYPELLEMVQDARIRVAERVAASAAWSPSLPTRSSGAQPTEQVTVDGSIEEGALPGPGELSVAQLAREYLLGRVQRGELRANSASVELGRLSHLIARCGHLSPRALDRQMLLRFQATIGSLAPSTRRHSVGAVQRFCVWMVTEGVIDSDPSITLIRPREPRREPRALGRQQVVTLLESLSAQREGDRGGSWHEPAIALMLGCGLRCVEVSRLDLADYDEYDGTIRVLGKGGHERVLPVPPTAAAALDKYIGERGAAAGPLFKATGSKGNPDGRLSAKWISKRTGRLMAQAGVHKVGDGRSAHALRHTAASDVLDRCHDVRTVQQMLGHASLQSTQIYLRRADLGKLREAMAGRDYTEKVAQ